MSKEWERPLGLPQRNGCSDDVAERTEVVYQRRLDWMCMIAADTTTGSFAKRYWLIYDQFKCDILTDKRAIEDVLPAWNTKQRWLDAGIVLSSPSPERYEAAGERSAPAEEAGTESPRPAKRARMGSPSPARGSTDGPPDVNAKKASDTMEMASQGAVVTVLLTSV